MLGSRDCPRSFVDTDKGGPSWPPDKDDASDGVLRPRVVMELLEDTSMDVPAAGILSRDGRGVRSTSSLELEGKT